MAYTKQSTEEKREKARERPIVGQYSDLAAVVRSLMGWEAESARPFLTAREASYKTGVSYSTIAAMTRGERPAADTIKRFAEGFGVDPLPLLQSAEYLENSSSLDLPDIPHDWLEKNASNLMRRGYEEKVQRVWRFWAKNEFDLLTDNEPPANLEIFLDDSFLNADPEWNSIRQGIFGVFALAIEYMDLRSKGLPDGWITSQTIEASRISINAKNFLRVIRIAIFEWSFRHYGGEQAGNIDAYWLTRYISGQIPNGDVPYESKHRIGALNFTKSLLEEAAESSDDSLITVAKSLNDALETDHPDFRSRLLAIALCGLVRIAYEELGGELLNNITSEYVHNWLWLLRIWYQEYSASILVEHKEPEISSWGQRYSPETIERDIEHTTELLSDDFALIYPDALLIPYQELGRPRPDILDAFEAEAYFEAALENGHAEALEVNELKHRLLNRLYLVAKLLHDRRLNVRRHLVPLPHLDTSRREWFLQDEIPQTLSDEILSLSDEIAYRKLRFLYSNNGIDIPEYNKLGSQKISINGIRHFTDTSRFIEEARRKYDKEIIISGATEDFEEVFSAFGPGYVAIPVNASKSEYLAARSCFVKDIRLGDMWAVEFDYKLSRYFDLLLEHWRLLEPFRQRSIDAMIRSEREAEQSSSIHEKDVQAGVRAEAEIEAEALEVLGFDINMRHDLKYDWSRQGYALTEELIQWYRTSSM